MRLILLIRKADESIQPRGPGSGVIFSHEGVDAVLVGAPERPWGDDVGELDEELAILEEVSQYLVESVNKAIFNLNDIWASVRGKARGFGGLKVSHILFQV